MAKKKLYKDYVNDEILEKIVFYRRRGHTEEQIYKMLGVSLNIGNRWKKEHDEFLKALKKGFNESIMEVENAYFRRAVGHFVDEKEETIVYDKNGEILNRTVKTKQKYIWSDTNAQHILKRRDPEYWADKIETETEEEVAKVLNKFKKIIKDS